MGQTRPRVLVVDDEIPFARLVAEVLEQKGYATTLAHDLSKAKALAAEGGFDAAILDLGLPGGSGLDVVEPLRASNRDAQVVILTGGGDVESAIRGIEHGVFGFLQKSRLDLGQLERTLSQAIARADLLRENRLLLAGLEESNRLLHELQEHSAGLSDEAHLDRLLPRLVAAAKALSGASAGRVLLFQRTQDVLVIETCVGDGGAALVGARLQPGDSLAGLVADEDRPIRLEDAAGDPRFSPRCDDFGSAGPAWLGVPLRRTGVLGALLVAGGPGGFLPGHENLLSNLARQAALLIDNVRQHERGINFFAHVSDLLVQVLERLDIHYPGHSRRVAALADMISRRLGLDEGERRTIHFAALLHDIGKIRIDPAVLTSAHALGDSRAELQRHPTYGLEILRSITAWEGVLPVVHAHHERWDGTGYPRGLSRENIPVGARIVAVADAFDAMTRSTPHGKSRTSAEALRELEACAGTQFDARVVRIFVAEFEAHGHPLDSGA